MKEWCLIEVWLNCMEWKRSHPWASKTQSYKVSCSFYVPFNRKGSWSHGIAKCDTIKTTFRGCFAICIYRTWSIDVTNIIKSDRAIQVSIKIIELFVKLREMLATHTELKLEIERIKKKIDNQDQNIEIVFRYFDELLEQKANPRKQIGFKLPKKRK